MRYTRLALLAGISLAAVSTQSTSAADYAVRPVTKGPLVAVPVSHWDGFYASVSGGVNWLRGDTIDSKNLSNSNSGRTVDATGTLIDSFDNSETSNTSGTTTGRDKGAIAVFAVGYNAVFNAWLVGVQAEGNWNKWRDVTARLQGVSSTTSTQSQTSLSGGASNSNSSNFSTDIQDLRLTNNWTASVMARLGFLLTQRWLVYGLIGWSISGFDLNDLTTDAFNRDLQRFSRFTLNGLTWGVGGEYDFGFLRGFVQYKAINYGSKDLITPQPGTGTNSVTQTNGLGVTGTFTSSTVNTVCTPLVCRFRLLDGWHNYSAQRVAPVILHHRC